MLEEFHNLVSGMNVNYGSAGGGGHGAVGGNGSNPTGGTGGAGTDFSPSFPGLPNSGVLAGGGGAGTFQGGTAGSVEQFNLLEQLVLVVVIMTLELLQLLVD